MNTAEQSQPSELGQASIDSRISAFLDGPPQPAPKEEVNTAEVEETEASADSLEETLADDGEATDEVPSEEEGGEEVEAVEDGKDADTDPDALVTVKIDGKVEKITVKEAAEGYQRQADYQRKTQALAEERKAIESVRQQTEAERAYYASTVSQLRSQLEAIAPQEPDWNRLHQEDPINFPIIEKQWRDYKANLQAVQQEEARLKQIAYQEEQYKLQHIVEEGRKFIVEKMPEWKDEAKWNSARGQLREYGKKIGYTDEELAMAYDPRAILVLEKARRYDALQANSPKPTQKASPKPLKQGTTAQSPRRENDLMKVKQRLKSSGHVDDAAALFAMLDRR
jgi:hypothetical protein